MLKNKYFARALTVIGGFLCYMVADGCTFSVGILYSIFLEAFDQSKASTAILPGLVYALPQCIAPFICPFVDVIGSYYSAVLGGTILFLSIFVSRFVTTLQVMYITIGFFTSIGLQLTYVSALLAVAKGFSDEKYLGLGLGITVSGSGIGVFVFNPILNFLINFYTWKGALTIESAIFFHVILAGMMFKLASKLSVDVVKENEKPKIQYPIVNIELIKSQENGNTALNVISQSCSLSNLNSEIENLEKKYDDIIIHPKPKTLNYEQRSSAIFSMTQTKHCEPFYKPINIQLKSKSLDRKINTGDNFSVSLPVNERSASFVRRLSLYSNQNVKSSHLESQESLSSKPSLLFEMAETDLIESRRDIDPIIEIHDSASLNMTHPKWTTLKDKLQRSLFSLFSIDIWRNKPLLYYYFISFLFAFSVVVLWTFSYDNSLLIDIGETKASLLVSMIGAGSCFGQIFFGYISEYVPAIFLYAIGCLIAGSIMIILRWVTVYWALILLHLGFGFGQGVSYSLFSVILLHYTSIELLPASLGIFLLLSGSGNLLGTFISGYVLGVTEYYGVVYIISGSILISCAIIAIPLICTWNSEN